MNELKEKSFHSAVYRGWVSHTRFFPLKHSFKYQVFMMYLDLDELDKVLATSRWWSKSGLGLARFKRTDYFNNPDVPLKKAVVERMKQDNIVVDGAVRMVTNLRYFGFIINPITVYYCFDRDEKLKALLVEVTNTPWGERHHYVLKCDPDEKYLRKTFNKELHVSPFNPMDMYYNWLSNEPQTHLSIHMQNRQILQDKDVCIFEATMRLKREEIESLKLTKLIFQYPFMTLKVFAGIYWQAAKLFMKKASFYRNPGTVKAEREAGLQR